MRKRIFKGIFATAILTLLVSLLIILGVLYNYFDGQMTEQLEEKAHYVAEGVELSGYSLLESLDTEDRVTLVAADGTVLFDNMALAAEMENHSNREEIKEALKDGTGEAHRYSDTLSEKTCYVAVQLSDGTVLRLANDQYTVWKLLMYSMLPVLGLFLLLILATYGLAAAISKRTVKPINSIDLENPDIDESYEELGPLVGRMKAQNKKIALQMEELRKKQQEFLVISNHMKEGLLIVNQNAEILSGNHSVKEFFNIEDEIIGKSVLALNRSEVLRDCIGTVLDGSHFDGILALNTHKYEIIANPVETDSGNGAVILIVDVTDREEREQLRREFTSNVSHELKTPLTSIYGMSDLLRNGMVKQEDVSGFAEDIHKEASRLIQLVADILKLSKLDEQEIKESNRWVDLYELSQEVENQLKSTAKEKDITLSIVGEHYKIFGNEDILYELIFNLCDNAIRYNKPNGFVRVELKQEKDKVLFSVLDNGIGIPKEHQNRVFERFYRVDKSHSKKLGGTGLGLSIVKHAANYHNAEISMESEENKGTKITIRFPGDGGKHGKLETGH